VAWTIPDKGEGDNDLQSILFQEYLDVLIAGLAGTDCVVSGCGITGGADMTPAVASGVVISNGVWFSVTGADVTISAANGTNPRLDLIVVNSSGALAVRTGTAAAAPKPPARSANDVVLGVVYVPASDTTIATSQVTDLRVIRDDIARQPVIIRADSTNTLTSATTAQKVFASPTNGRITLDVGTYTFEALIALTSMSATSGNATFDLAGGTATLGSILWHGFGRDIAADGATGTYAGSWSADATLVTAPLVTAGTGTAAMFKLEGTFEVTAAGTVQLRILLQTAAAAIVSVGSFMRVQKISGANNTTAIGLWD